MTENEEPSGKWKLWVGVFAVLVVLGVGLQSAIAGILVTLLGAGAAGWVMFGNRLPRRHALVPAVLSVSALVGTVGGALQRYDLAKRAEATQSAAQALTDAEKRRVEALRLSVPSQVATARGILEQARPLVVSGRFGEAAVLATQAFAGLNDVASLSPIPSEVSVVRVEAEALRNEATLLQTTGATLAEARSLAGSTPAEQPVEWDEKLERLSSALRLAPASARARFGTDLVDAAERLDGLRARFRREVERGRRDEARADENVARGLRDGYASQLDAQLVRDGVAVEKVETVGEGGRTLRVRYALCNRVVLDRLFGTAAVQRPLTVLGFRRVECRSAFETAWIELVQPTT